MLFIEPHAGPAPVTQVIEAARKQVDLNVYEITSHRVERALQHACHNGVNVRVMIDTRPYHASRIVKKEKRALSGGCIKVKAAPPRFEKKYVFDHAKYVVADPDTHPLAELGTANYTWSAFHRNREYLWDTRARTTVKALATVFEDDWNRKPVGSGPRQHLLLSPHSAKALVYVIGQKGRVDIEAEEMGDAKRILKAIKSKAGQVRVILPASTSGWDKKHAKALQAAGVHVRLIHRPYMHAKMIVGSKLGFIGSENFSRSSLYKNREAGVVFDGKKTLHKLRDQFSQDWRRAKPL